jgi:hypothetical protein
MTISRKRAPEWADDRQGFLFGVAKMEQRNGGAPASRPDEDTVAPDTERRSRDAGRDKDGTPTDKLPDLVLWHWKDVQQQSAQQYYENYNKARDYYLATYRIDEKRFIQLADDAVREVVAPKRGRWAVAFDHREYELLASLDGRQYRDVYIVDLNTGARRLAIRRLRWFFSVAAVYHSSHALSQSPDGEKVLFYQDGHFHVLDAASVRITNITLAVPTSFVNTEADRDVVKPPVRTLGWATDSRHVLLSDAWDVWQIPVSGVGAVNLTANGRRDDIRYDFADTDADDSGIDLSVPQYYGARGEWTKKAGIARGSSGKSGVEVLCWDDAYYGDPMRARRAERVVYSRQTRQDYPDYYAADPSLKGSRRITNGQEQVDKFVWATEARLLDYTSDGPHSGGRRGRKS